MQEITKVKEEGRKENCDEEGRRTFAGFLDNLLGFALGLVGMSA